tara:strand:+ start:66 stop:545 length:480 start_codon:yes stop_codon:yes gene_type:complete
VRYFFVLAIFAFSLSVEAGDQYQLDVTVTRGDKVLLSTHTITTGDRGLISNGGTFGYGSLTCEKANGVTKKELSVNMIFSGLKIISEVGNSKASLKIEEHKVDSKDKEIEDSDGKCTNLKPQVTVYKDSVEFDYTENKPFHSSLKNGKELEVKVTPVKI